MAHFIRLPVDADETMLCRVTCEDDGAVCAVHKPMCSVQPLRCASLGSPLQGRHQNMQMILDSKLAGTLDAGAGCLEVL